MKLCKHINYEVIEYLGLRVAAISERIIKCEICGTKEKIFCGMGDQIITGEIISSINTLETQEIQI